MQGKSIFLFYLLLRLLSMGEPVALQRGEFFYVFSQDGVEMHRGDTTGWIFRFKGKLWGSQIPDRRAKSHVDCFNGLVGRNARTLSKQLHQKKCGGRNGKRSAVDGSLQ